MATENKYKAKEISDFYYDNIVAFNSVNINFILFMTMTINMNFEYLFFCRDKIADQLMELSQNYEFLAAALAAITGDLVLDTREPGDNTKIPDQYKIDHLWHEEEEEQEENSFDLEALDERVLTYHCPTQDEITEGPVLYIRTVTGVKLKLFIDRSNTVLSLKKKIQEKIGIHPDQQRLLPFGFNSRHEAIQEQDSEFFMRDLWPISKYENDLNYFYDNTIILILVGANHQVPFYWTKTCLILPRTVILPGYTMIKHTSEVTLSTRGPTDGTELLSMLKTSILTTAGLGMILVMVIRITGQVA